MGQVALRPGVLLRAQETWTLIVLGLSCWLFAMGGWYVLGGFVGLLLITLVIARGQWLELPEPVIDETKRDPWAIYKQEPKYVITKRAVVTGGTQGIGAALSQVLKEQGFDVYCGGRTAGGHYIDLGEAATIKAFANRVKSVLRGEPLDLIVINAGVWNASHRNTWDGFESTLQVNHFGHAYLVDLLLPCLKLSEDPRIVIVSSLAAYGGLPQLSVADWQAQLSQDPPYYINTYPAMFHRYADSKLCNIMFAQTLKKQHPWLCVTVCHPGSCYTNLIGGMTYHFAFEFCMRILFKSPTGAAQTILYCCLADKKDLRTDAVYSEMSEMPLPWQVTPNACRILYEATEIEKKRMAKTAAINVGSPTPIVKERVETQKEPEKEEDR